MLNAIFEAALRSLGLALVGVCIVRIFLRQSPRLEMMTWTFVLVGALAMPAVMQRAPIALWPMNVSRSNASALGEIENAPTLQNTLTAAPLAADAAPRAEPIVAASTKTATDWRFLAGVVYLVVAFSMISRLALGLALAWARWRSAEPLDDRRLSGRDIRIVRGLSSPTTFGRAILLPANCGAWSETMWRAVLAHETSHIERADFFVQMLAAVHRALFWFSPLAWFLTRRLSQLAETLSDRDATASLGDPTAYAEALLSIAARTENAAFGVAMAHGPDVAARIDRILKEATMETDMSVKHRQGWLIAALLAPTFVLAAGASAADAPAPNPSSTASAEAPPPDLERFVGAYTVGPPRAPDQALTISKRGDRYYAKWTGFDEQEIVAPNHDVTLGGRHIRVKDVVMKDGAIESFEFFWRGEFSAATRTDEAEAKRLEGLFEQRKADQNAPRHVIAINPRTLDGLVGYYLINEQKVFHVTRDGDHLYNQTTGQRRVEIFPEEERKFFYTTSPTQLTFNVDAQGVATGVILHQYGLERPCPRASEAKASEIETAFAARYAEQHKPHMATTIDPTSLQEYVGTYELNAKLFLTATREDGRLFMQTTGQNKYEVFPYDKNSFFYTVSAAQLSFEVGDDGKTRRVVLHQNGWEMGADRVDAPKNP